MQAGHARYLLPWGSLRLEPHSAVWLFPQHEHVLVDQDRDFRMWVVVWRPDLVAELCAGVDPLPAALRAPAPPGDWFRRLGRGAVARLERLCDDVQAATGSGRSCDAGLAWLLVQAWNAFATADLLAPGEPAHPAVRKALFLLAGADPPADLPQLAMACGLSPDRLGRLFRRDTGTSISTYRNRLRCEHACRLLVDTDADLTDIALQAGFGSYTHLHRVFVAQFGMPPGRWRARH